MSRREACANGYLSVVKFGEHQHYKTRKPPWIKLYTSLLNPSHPMNKLPIEARYLFTMLLLLAAEWDNSIPNDPELIARLAAMSPRKCREMLAMLIKGRWVQERKTKRRASTHARPRTREETETETETDFKKEKTRAVPAPRTAGPANSGDGYGLDDLRIRAQIVKSLDEARANREEAA